MQYYVGPLVFDTFPFSVTSISREDGEDFAKHDLLSRRKGYEPAGPGDDVLTLGGEFLPFHIGGLASLEYARSLKGAAAPLFVMRGDGFGLGWFVITSLEEGHETLIAPNGLGYVVKHKLKLENVGAPGGSAGADLIDTILSLF